MYGRVFPVPSLHDIFPKLVILKRGVILPIAEFHMLKASIVELLIKFKLLAAISFVEIACVLT